MSKNLLDFFSIKELFAIDSKSGTNKNFSWKHHPLKEQGLILKRIFDLSSAKLRILLEDYLERDSFRKCIQCGQDNYRLRNLKFLDTCSITCAKQVGRYNRESTMLSRYGVKNNSQLSSWKENQGKIYKGDLIKKQIATNKRRQTKMNLYGDPNYHNKEKHIETLNNKSVEDKVLWVERRKDHFRSKYGVINNTQVPHLFDAQRGYRRKPVQLGGRVVYLQGYEPLCLNYLITQEKYLPEEITTSAAEGRPSLRYYYLNKRRVYHPDFYIPSENRIIEVKSEYTYKKELDKNLAKLAACKSQGYNVNFYIMDGKGRLLEKL